LEWQGLARISEARISPYPFLQSEAELGMAWLREAGHGEARNGIAWSGLARQGNKKTGDYPVFLFCIDIISVTRDDYY
jgi:hypothetical protein